MLNIFWSGKIRNFKIYIFIYSFISRILWDFPTYFNIFIFFSKVPRIHGGEDPDIEIRSARPYTYIIDKQCCLVYTDRLKVPIVPSLMEERKCWVRHWRSWNRKVNSIKEIQTNFIWMRQRSCRNQLYAQLLGGPQFCQRGNSIELVEFTILDFFPFKPKLNIQKIISLFNIQIIIHSFITIFFILSMAFLFLIDMYFQGYCWNNIYHQYQLLNCLLYNNFFILRQNFKFHKFEKALF